MSVNPSRHMRRRGRLPVFDCIFSMTSRIILRRNDLRVDGATVFGHGGLPRRRGMPGDRRSRWLQSDLWRWGCPVPRRRPSWLASRLRRLINTFPVGCSGSLTRGGAEYQYFV